MIVKADIIRWHRKGFRLFRRWKCKPAGRPPAPKELRRLIRQIAAENPTWGEERIANELGPGFPEPTRTKFRSPTTGTRCQPVIASRERLCSPACITNTAW